MRFLVLALLLALLVAPTGLAHAVYLDSNPAKGARLDQAPTDVWVLLTEPVDPDKFSFDVVDLQGNRISQNPQLVASPQARLSAALQPNTAPGAYLMQWQVLSTADGHVTSGSTGFAIGDATPPPSNTDNDAQTSLLAPWARLASFIGLCLAAGALMFLWLQRHLAPVQERLRSLLETGTWVNAAGVVLLLVDTVRQSGLTLSELLDTQVGTILAVRLTASAAAIFTARAFHQRQHKAAALATIGFLAVAGAASARLGHASLAGASAILVDFVHLAAVAIWLGGLVAYWSILLQAKAFNLDEAEVRRMGLTFSPVALLCVTVLTVTGLATTWTITKDYTPSLQLLSSPWGRFLALKIGLFIVMLGLAAINRYVLLAPPRGWLAKSPFAKIGQGEPPAVRIRRVVQVEAIFGLGTLFLAALLTSISPPALASVPDVEPVEVIESHGEVYGFFGSWNAPPQSGASTTLTLQILDHHEGAIVSENTCGRDSCILLEISPPGGSGVQVYRVEPMGDGRWQSEAILWVTTGFHEAVLKVQTADVYLDQMTFTVAVT